MMTPSLLPRGRRIALLLLVAAVACGAYARTLSFELVWDDPLLLKALDRELGEGGVARLATMKFPLGTVAGSKAGYYRPVTLASLFVDSRLLSGAPAVFHLTNVLLHALASVLLCLLLWLAVPSLAGGLAGALLFAVHPVHVEAVAFVSGRTDLLAGVFALLAALAWLRERNGRSRTPLAGRVVAGAALFLGTLSKETAVMLPPVLLAWDAVAPPEGRPEAGWWRRNRPWLATWALALAAAAFLRFAVAAVGLLRSPGAPAPGGVAGVAAGVAQRVLSYFKLLVFPWPLNAYYTPDQIAVGPLTLLGAAILLAACALCASGRSGRAGLVALAWIVGFTAPAFGIAAASASAAVAERFLYLPSAGLALLVAAAAARIPSRARASGAVAGAAILALLAALAVSRSAVWRDEKTFIARLTKESPRYWAGWYNLGNIRSDEGRYPEAVELYRTAAELDPRQPDLYYNLGNAFAAMGDQRRAVAAYLRALELDPGFADAAFNLGNSYLMLGMIPESRAAHARAAAATAAPKR